MDLNISSLKNNLKSSGYNYFMTIPLISDVVLGNSEYIIIKHNDVNFVWVNGNQEYYPLIQIPIKVPQLVGSLVDNRVDFSSFRQAIEYITILTFNHNYKIEIDNRRFKNYFFPIDRIDENLKTWIGRSTYQYKIDDYMLESLEGNEHEISLIRQMQSYFREGLNSQQVMYSYICLFKIFEIKLLQRIKNGKNEKHNNWLDFYEWIDLNMEDIKYTFITLFPSGGLSHIIDNYEKAKQAKQTKAASYKKTKDTTPFRFGSYLVEIRNKIAHGQLDNFPVLIPSSFLDYSEAYYASQFMEAAANIYINKLIDNLDKDNFSIV